MSLKVGMGVGWEVGAFCVAGVFADGAGCGLVCEIAALAVKSMMPSASCGRVTDMRLTILAEESGHGGGSRASDRKAGPSLRSG